MRAGAGHAVPASRPAHRKQTEAYLEIEIVALLVGAGIAGGIVNAIAGGATLITFPAMLAAGLPPVLANASNAVAVTPGHLIAAFADRPRLPAFDRRFAALMVTALAGGTVGAVLLLSTPEDMFTALVPALIGSATLVFLLAGRIQLAVRRWAGHAAGHFDGRLATILAGPASIYGGYFGAGLGVMLMAVLTVAGQTDVQRANVLKNLMSSAVSAATITIFTVRGAVVWPETLVMLAGAVAGGFLGGNLVKILPPRVVRAVVILIGAGTSLIYAYRYWL